ncbi:MAG TPA: class I SAM-dependent methyltransferase family protein, partial [Candidatus Methanomethylia archaeon]|nr:class I SAM-dependent methyltransferase family protein [Candidatus Methanomethylicia archaeon]
MPRESMMLRAARRIFPPEEQRHIYKSIDIIGDIAIIKVARRHEVYAQQLAEALLEELKGRVKVVYRQTAPTKGYERVKILEWLAGERRSITIYREHGCSFKVDVEKVFFSPRLQYERLRIARLVKKEAPLKGGEVVVNMFSGVGTFSIIIAKHAPK